MTSTPSSSAMSPASDMGSDEGRVRPVSYLAHIAGCTGRDVSKDRETDLIMLDHCYSKPWNAHPEASHARPARTLFMSKISRNKSIEPPIDSKHMINLEGDHPKQYTAIDLPKAQGLMNECHRHANLIRMEEGQDDWEEQLNRIGLTPTQNKLFTKVIKVLHLLRLACLSCAGRHDEPVQRRIHVDKAAKRMRQTLALYSWETKLMQWLHAILMEFLNSSYLAVYFDILQTLKSKVPSLVDKMIAVSSSSSKVASAASESLNLLLKRPWDPAASGISLYKPKKLPGSPLLLVVASGPPHFMSSYSRRSLFWNSHLSCLGKTISLSLPASNSGNNVSISQCLELMISTVRNKVTEIQSHSPNRPIVLIGWNVGSLIACHVSLLENVAAVVCLGFPVLGINGGRGDVDDPLLESKTPTLFVIGQNSSVCNQDDLEEMREKMKTETSLVIVGGADENLCLCWTKKKMESITQSMLDRCLLDEISDFLGTVLTHQPLHTPDNSCTSANSSDSSSCRDRRRRHPKAMHEDSPLPIAPMKRKGNLIGSRQADWIKRKKRWPHLKNQGPAGNKHSSLQKNTNSQTKAELGKRQLAFNSTRRRRNQNLNSPVTNRKQQMWPPVDSFSSDSSNQSQQSTNQMSGSEIGSEESQGAGDDELISGKQSSSNSARGICLNIGSLSSLGQLRQKSSQPTNPPEPVYNYQSSYIRAGATPATSALTTETTTSRSKGSRMKSRPTSAFLSVQKSSSSVLSSSPVMSSILSSNSPNPGSMIIAATNKSVEPDQQQVQAIQKLQFHDFPLTTASLTKTGIGGGPVITQAKILSNINKLQGLITTTTATTGMCQSLLPGIPSVTTTTTATQSLLTSTASAFVSRQFLMGKSFTSGIASPKQGATSLLIGKNNRTSSSPSVKLQFSSSTSLSSNPEIALLMVPPDSEIEALESELPKDLNDVSGNNETLLELIRDISETEGTFEEGALAAIPEIAALAPAYCSLLSENSGTHPISDLDKANEFANLAISSEFQADDILEANSVSTVEENSLLPVVLRSTLDEADASQLNPEDNQFSPNSMTSTSVTDGAEQQVATPFVTFGRAHRLSYPTVAATRTRRIRTPKYFDA